MHVRPAVFLFAALTIAVGGPAIAWKSVSGLNCLWDERIDLDIAAALRENPLTGEHPTLDASQARLPMYVNALVFKLTGARDLATSRIISLGVAAIAILGTAFLGRMLFGSLTGLLAALFLGLSPYFLSFARIAMTEGDVFFACATTFALGAFVGYLRTPTPARWLLAGFMLALALGAKFFGLFLVPVFALLAAAGQSESRVADLNNGNRANIATEPAGRFRLTLLLFISLMLIASTLVVVSNVRKTSFAAYAPLLAIVGWLMETSLLGYLCIFVGQRRILPLTALGRCAALGALALIACCVMMPVHMTEPNIAIELIRRTLHWDHRVPLALWSDHLRLYAGIILIKLTVPLGILTALALIYAAIRERKDARWRPCIFSTIAYVTLLCFLPIRQTFYLMGVYPLIMILLAAFITEIPVFLRARKSTGRRLLWAGWTLCAGGLIVHLCYVTQGAFPNFNLHGYAQIGDRWLGVESRGYRNLIQTPSDGVEDLIDWIDRSGRVRAGAGVVSYLWEDHIINPRLSPGRTYVWIPRGLSLESDIVPPPPPIDRADFVLLHINNLLGYGDRPPDTPPLDVLNRDFEVAHTVHRGALCVAWVYARARPVQEPPRPTARID